MNLFGVNMFDVAKIRKDFPFLQKTNTIYFDNGATALKPKSVIDEITYHYNYESVNVNRGVYRLSQIATEKFDETRNTVKDFINAKYKEEIIFTKGTTDSINLLALSLGELLNKGDEVIISEMEHHANFVPWQMLRDRKGIVLKMIPIDKNGELIYEEYLKLLTSKTKLVSVTWVSNLLGTINNIEQIIKDAHNIGALVSIDGAQAVPHLKIDVEKLDIDFLSFSAHKMYGPTGVGVLYGKKELLEKMPPVFGGGDMINVVTLEKTTYNDLPHKFEAGTPNIADVIAFKRAIEYMNAIGIDSIANYEHELLEYAVKKLSVFDDLTIIGTSKNKSETISFTIKGVHPQDIGMLLDEKNIAVRTGHHCAQPALKKFNLKATTRASFAFYNTKEEIDRFIEGINYIYDIFN